MNSFAGWEELKDVGSFVVQCCFFLGGAVAHQESAYFGGFPFVVLSFSVLSNPAQAQLSLL